MGNIVIYTQEVFHCHNSSDANAPYNAKEYEAKAIAAGLNYYVCDNSVYEVNPSEHYPSPLCKRTEIRIGLSVPFSEKDEAKRLGARWDNDQRIWYCTSNDEKALLNLFRWCKESDRIYLSYEDQHRDYVLLRGEQFVRSDNNGKLYIPSWYWTTYRTYSHIISIRLCYWLPDTHIDHKRFRNASEAATWLAFNHWPGYMNANHYLPEEFSALKNDSAWYILECKGFSYFRYKIWDKD